jgi:hypothetical protein
MSSRLVGCGMRTRVFRQGIVGGVDPGIHLIELTTELAQMHVEDTCVAANNGDRHLEPEGETLLWERTTDEHGDALYLRRPDTAWSLFRPAS